MSSPLSTRVGQVFIPVRDMPAAVAWYARLFGFDADTGRLGHGDTIFDIPTDAPPYLCLDANQPDFVASGPARCFFLTEDLDATVAHVGAIGATEVSPVEDIGSLRFATFRDPDGNLLMAAQLSSSDAPAAAGQPVPMVTSGLVNVFTHDIEAAVAFYQGVLGLPETFRTPREGTPEHVEMEAGGFVLAISTAEAARRVHGLDAEVGAPAMTLVFWVDDVDATWQQVTDGGAPAVAAPHDAGNGNRNAVVRGPDGVLVELVAKRS